METTYNKTNKEAKTTVHLPELGDNKYLEISTRKGYNKGTVQTTASVSEITHERGFQVKTHAMFQDFHKTVAQVPCKRVTLKAIETTHDKVLPLVEDIKSLALSHYGK